MENATHVLIVTVPLAMETQIFVKYAWLGMNYKMENAPDIA